MILMKLVQNINDIVVLCHHSLEVEVVLYLTCERRGCVVVSTSALHARVLSSRPGLRIGLFVVKTWLSTLETVYLSLLG